MARIGEQARLVLDLASIVSRRHSKGLLRQATEIMRMKSQNPTLGVRDYYRFGLYDPELIRSSGIGEFLGWRAERDLALALNPRAAVTPAWDKLSYLVLMHAYGLPVPRLRAVFRPGPALSRDHAEVALRTPDELGEWLRKGAQWPVFAKPSWSQQSVGAYYFVGHDPDDDALLTKGGKRVPVGDFVASVLGTNRPDYYRPEMGYLFQDALRPHPRIVSLLANDTISGVRIVLIRDHDGTEIVRAIWRIATGNNDTDQYVGVESGQLFADIDPQTGRVPFALQRAWPRAQPIETMPDSGHSIAGFVLPDWDDALALCQSASALFPLMRIQHWDVALTSDGPCLLEVNDIGAISMPQSFGRGLLTPRIRRLLRTHGDARRFRWITRLCG